MLNRSVAIAALSAGAIVMTSSAQAATTWVCNVFTGPKHFVNKGLKAWGRDVGKVTKGAVKIRFLPTSAAPPPKQIDGTVGHGLGGPVAAAGPVGRRPGAGDEIGAAHRLTAS